MTTTLIPERELAVAQDCERRIGKSFYYLVAQPEEFGLSRAWRLCVVWKPTRPNKHTPPQTVFHFTPQKPLFTCEIGGERFPLMINDLLPNRRGSIRLTGKRQVGRGASNVVRWTADVAIEEQHGDAVVSIVGQFRYPRGAAATAAIAVQIPFTAYEPEIVPSPTMRRDDISSAGIWTERSRTGIAVAASSPSIAGFVLTNGVLSAQFDSPTVRGRASLWISIGLRSASSQLDVVKAVRRRVAAMDTSRQPSSYANQRLLGDAARASLSALVDRKNITVQTVVRWNFQCGDATKYCPGFPFFTAEASPCLVRWSRFFLSETAIRTAGLTSHGVVGDFSEMIGESGAEGNKGAFWDCADASTGHMEFAAVNGNKEYGIASSARIAVALFQMHDATQDLLFRQAALNTCQWLILKQNAVGYFDGIAISAKTGRIVENRIAFDGVWPIRALVAAFRSTGNEVFVKQARKMANYVTDNLVSGSAAGCLFGLPPGSDCPVALGSAIQAFLDLNEEAPNDEMLKSVSVAAEWLAINRFDPEEHSCLDYDGFMSGILECASSCLRLFIHNGELRWFHIGRSLIDRALATAPINWRYADLFVQLHLSIARLVPGTVVDLARQTVTTQWHKYVPDSAVTLYYEIVDGDGRLVDFIALVCRDSHQVLVLLLVPSAVTSVRLNKLNTTSSCRMTIVDIVTNNHCSTNLPLHPLSTGDASYSIVRIDP